MRGSQQRSRPWKPFTTVGITGNLGWGVHLENACEASMVCWTMRTPVVSGQNVIMVQIRRHQNLFLDGRGWSTTGTIHFAFINGSASWIR